MLQPVVACEEDRIAWKLDIWIAIESLLALVVFEMSVIAMLQLEVEPPMVMIEAATRAIVLSFFNFLLQPHLDFGFIVIFLPYEHSRHLFFC